MVTCRRKSWGSRGRCTGPNQLCRVPRVSRGSRPGNVLNHHLASVLFIRYMHRNPVRRGLVQAPELWRWSSFRAYAYRETGMARVNEWSVQQPKFMQPTTLPQSSVVLTQVSKSARPGPPGLGHQPVAAGYPAAQMLRKYSYPTCTFVILTKPRNALRWRRAAPGVCREACPHRPRAGLGVWVFDNLRRCRGRLHRSF